MDTEEKQKSMIPRPATTPEGKVDRRRAKGNQMEEAPRNMADLFWWVVSEESKETIHLLGPNFGVWSSQGSKQLQAFGVLFTCPKDPIVHVDRPNQIQV